MKQAGCKMVYSRRRELDLLCALRCLSQLMPGARKQSLYASLAVIGAPQFYVSDARAKRMVRLLLNDKPLPPMVALRREMYMEIARRVAELRSRRPRLSLSDAVARVVLQPAPQFYLTTKGIANVLYQAERRGGHEC